MSIRLYLCLWWVRLFRRWSVWADARADALAEHATRLNIRELNRWRKKNGKF